MQTLWLSLSQALSYLILMVILPIGVSEMRKLRNRGHFCNTMKGARWNVSPHVPLLPSHALSRTASVSTITCPQTRASHKSPWEHKTPGQEKNTEENNVSQSEKNVTASELTFLFLSWKQWNVSSYTMKRPWGWGGESQYLKFIKKMIFCFN